MEARNRRRKEEAERILLRAALDASVSRGGNPFASPPPVAAPRPSLASALRNLGRSISTKELLVATSSRTRV